MCNIPPPPINYLQFCIDTHNNVCKDSFPHLHFCSKPIYGSVPSVTDGVHQRPELVCLTSSKYFHLMRYRPFRLSFDIKTIVVKFINLTYELFPIHGNLYDLLYLYRDEIQQLNNVRNICRLFNL